MKKLRLGESIEKANRKFEIKKVIVIILGITVIYAIALLALNCAQDVVSAFKSAQFFSSIESRRDAEKLLKILGIFGLSALVGGLLGTSLSVMINHILGKIGLKRVAKHLSHDEITISPSDLRQAEVIRIEDTRTITTSTSVEPSKEIKTTNIVIVPSKLEEPHVVQEKTFQPDSKNRKSIVETELHLLGPTEAEEILKQYPEIAIKVKSLGTLH